MRTKANGIFRTLCVVLLLCCLACGEEEGTEDTAYLTVEVLDSNKVQPGNTLFSDVGSSKGPRLIEVDISGAIVWEYVLPDWLKNYTNPGFDCERTKDDTILFVAPTFGVFEVNRSGSIIWAYTNSKVSHDADRLDNGNTLIVWGGIDSTNDAQIKEVTPDGSIHWEWYATNCFDPNTAPYNVSCQGWTHANAVTRLSNGNTLVSLRNFNMVAVLDGSGNLLHTITNLNLYYPHDPEITSNNTLCSASQYPLANCDTAQQTADTSYPMVPVVEVNTNDGSLVWSYNASSWSDQLTRDVDRLPNGNTLITGTDLIIEVTAEGEIVWQLRKTGGEIIGDTAASGGFYKAQRIY